MRNILIVDDNRDNVEILKDILSADYQIHILETGELLMKYLKREEKPDLILLSYSLPDKSSVEVLRELRGRENLHSVPVVVLTKGGDAAIEAECLEAGAEDSIAAPMMPEVVRSRIGRIIQLNTLKEELQEAMKDPLTGMYNRSYAEKRIKEYLKDNSTGSFFMIDLDNFKHINDVFGHVAGDSTLKYVADTLVRAVGDDGIACRMGGDEFSLFLYPKLSRGQIAKKAVDILNEYNRTAVENDNMTGTSLSIGIAIVGKDGDTYEDLYNAADKALYFSKRNGKNSYYFYSKGVTQEDDCHDAVVDIHQLERLIQDRKKFAGAYQVDYNEFQRIYNFIERCVERTHQKAQLMLVSLRGNHDEGNPQELLETEIQHLEDAIIRSLRRNDVSARYSNRQILVVLIDIEEDKLNIVRNRISSNYDALKKVDSYSVTFEQMLIQGTVDE